MKVLICASEAAPFAKTGGLADVIGALPKALADIGVDVAVVMPFYKKNKNSNIASYIGFAYVKIYDRMEYVGIFKTVFNEITYYFIDNEKYFYRDNIYGYNDDGERFAFFNFAILEAIKVIDFYPDVIHINDWQTGLIPYILKTNYKYYHDYQRIKTVYSIHNIQYQGSFPFEIIRILYVPYSSSLEFQGNINFMKCGIVESTAITTVSKAYKSEILTDEYGYYLNNILGFRYYDLYGIINGLDIKKYDPLTDTFIYSNYSLSTVISGKRKNKTALYKEMDLSNLDVPLFGLVSRLVDQKGIDLLMTILEDLVNSTNANFILMGAGEERYETFFKSMEVKFPKRIKTYIGYNDVFAQKIYAASDIFLMPSKFEPCGLGQMIAMRYGTLPLVRETGGLKDTVFAYNEITGEGNGFSFKNYNPIELKNTILYAISTYSDKIAWKKLIKHAMSADHSWNASAKEYVELYKKITI